MRWVYTVQVLIEAPDRWYDLCRCYGPDTAAEVVRVLLTTRDPRLCLVRVYSAEEPYAL